VTTVGCVVLTMGNRPVELDRALRSVLAQQQVDVDVVVVGNGWEPTGLPPGVRSVALATNRGAGAGRNGGVPAVGGSVVLFLDDDAELVSTDFLARAAAMFAADARLGAVQPRPVDSRSGATPRSFIPRLRVGDPSRDSDLVALWEGVVVARRETVERVGGWPEVYFPYQHEGIEFAWRIIDAGYRIRYVGDLLVRHDAVAPGRVPEFYRLQGRNRVWLARRNLPMPLAIGHLLTWAVLTVLRLRRPNLVLEAARGWKVGFVQDPGPRRPISWRTAWRMTRAGRPPIV
jgi:GT2 family glycosyltransferase